MLNRTLLIVMLLTLLVISWQSIENHINARRLERGQTALEAFIPSPLTIYKTLIAQGDVILAETGYTLKKALLGCLLGTILAICMSLIFLITPLLRSIFLPIAFGINSFPIVGLAPAVILAFGQGSWSSIVFISTLISYFPVLISLDTAFRQTDQGMLELMYVFRASPLQTFIKVRLPLSIPYLFLALKLAFPASIIGATMGEWLGCRFGIGQLITISLYQLKPGLLYASLLLIVVISSCGVLIISLFEYLFLPWNRKSCEVVRTD